MAVINGSGRCPYVDIVVSTLDENKKCVRHYATNRKVGFDTRWGDFFKFT
jgi:hypothetical protein